MIYLLDCTLRDGGHVNDGRFDQDLVVRVINGLSSAGLDYVEIAQLGSQFSGRSSGTFRGYFSDLKDIVSEYRGAAKLLVMLRQDWQDWGEVPKATQELSGVRLAFRKRDLQQVESSVRLLGDLGYTVSLNPIDTPSYSPEELSLLVELTNKIHPFAITVVDTYGALIPSVMRRLLDFLHLNLRPEVAIGFHLHDNLLLASSHLYTIIEAAELSGARDYVVDASLVGLGRPPGNLKLELAALALNSEMSSSFDMSVLSEIIEAEILPIRNAHGVVYEPVYAYSAHLGVDRTFAETLSKDLDLGLAQSFAALVEVQRRGLRDFSKSGMDQALEGLAEAQEC